MSARKHLQETKIEENTQKESEKRIHFKDYIFTSHTIVTFTYKQIFRKYRYF